MPFRGTRGTGGKREGAGRKPEWLQNQCKSLVEKNGLIDFLASVAVGFPVRHVVSIDGAAKEGKVSADVKDRLKAVEMMLDRGWGKPKQSVEHSGNVGVIELIAKAEYSGE